MRFVLQGVASEDMVQLFDSAASPVLLVPYDEILVYIRKEGAFGYTQKTIVLADWAERDGGNYSIQFSAGDFDTLGLFRYQIISTTSAFVPYEDALEVVEEIPSFPPQPPTINEQTDVPPGVTPDPVYRGSSLFINGSDLGGALSVSIGGELVPIINNTDSQIEVTVISSVPLGDELDVVVNTAGGTAEATVAVVLDPADIPGAGMINIYGFIHYPGTGNPISGIAVYGRVLDMPNIEDGVGWTDDEITASTNSDGRFDINLPRDTTVEINIPRIRYRRVFLTPDLISANLFTEIV